MRAVVVEDEGLLLDLMAEALTSRSVQVVGRVRNPDDAAAVVIATAPDIAILDIRLPPTFTDEGIQLASLLRRRCPEVALLVLSSHAEVSYAERLLGLEADTRSLGYLLKERVGDLRQLVDVMGRLVAGEVVIDSSIVGGLMTRRRAGDPLAVLTAHERRILGLVAEGRSNLGIAQQLGTRISTVEKHLSVITDKLGLPAAGDTTRPGVNVRVLAALTFLKS
jgi:DNA-binding NarL/FixJ family response regulator